MVNEDKTMIMKKSDRQVVTGIVVNEGLNVKGLISIFTYGFDAAAENFKKADCNFISLCDYPTLLQEALKQDYIKQSDLEILEKWREDPSKWKKVR